MSHVARTSRTPRTSHPTRALRAPGIARRRGAMLAAATLALTGCSADSLMERALEQVDGVEDIDLDRDGGTFSFRSEDGEEFSIDGDSGTSRMVTEDGEATSGPTSEIPEAIASVVDLPASFEPRSQVEIVADESTNHQVQGLIRGDFDALLDEIEAAARATPFTEVEVQVLSPGVMGSIMAQAPSDDGTQDGLIISLVMEADQDEGMLQVMRISPTG